MSLKDKLEIGLKPEAPYRRSNLPEQQQGDPDCEKGSEPGNEPEQEKARDRCGADDPRHDQARGRRPVRER